MGKCHLSLHLSLALFRFFSLPPLLLFYQSFSSNKLLSDSTFLTDYPAMRLIVTPLPLCFSDPPPFPLPLAPSLSLSHTSLVMLIPQVIEDTIHSVRVRECVCVTTHSGRDCVWEGEMSFPPLITFLRLGPALLLAGRKSDGNAITIS